VSKPQIVLTNREAGIALVLLAIYADRIEASELSHELQAVLHKVQAGVDITNNEDGTATYETRFTIQPEGV
jgi:hypothetical protein